MPYTEFLELARRDGIFLQWIHLRWYFALRRAPEAWRDLLARGVVPEHLTPQEVQAALARPARRLE